MGVLILEQSNRQYCRQSGAGVRVIMSKSSKSSLYDIYACTSVPSSSVLQQTFPLLQTFNLGLIILSFERCLQLKRNHTSQV